MKLYLCGVFPPNYWFPSSCCGEWVSSPTYCRGPSRWTGQKYNGWHQHIPQHSKKWDNSDSDQRLSSVLLHWNLREDTEKGSLGTNYYPTQNSAAFITCRWMITEQLLCCQGPPAPDLAATKWGLRQRLAKPNKINTPCLGRESNELARHLSAEERKEQKCYPG